MSLSSCTYILTTSAPTIIYITGISKSYAPFIEAKPCDKNVPNCTAEIYQTLRRQCTKLYGGNWRWVMSVTSGAGVAMEEIIPNLTAALYHTLRRQCTKLYGGNVPTVRRQCTKRYGGNWRRGRGGTLTKYPGKSRKPKTPQRYTYTTDVKSTELLCVLRI